MPAIVQDVTIATTPEKVFCALTFENEIAQWWTNDLSVKPEVGTVSEFRFPGGFALQFEIAELQKEEKVYWILRQGPPSWLNTSVTWLLTRVDGGTHVHFSHDGFAQVDGVFQQTKGNWAHFIQSLQSYLEIGKGNPGLHYHKTIITTASAEEVFEKISSVSTRWTPNIKRSAKHLNDVFTMWAGDTTQVTLQVVEVVPHKKLVWLVTDCQLLWLKDTTEWKNTHIVFDISEGKHQTRIAMTHVGLVPQVECYNICENGWNGHLNDLAAWIETGISPLV